MFAPFYTWLRPPCWYVDVRSCVFLPFRLSCFAEHRRLIWNSLRHAGHSKQHLTINTLHTSTPSCRPTLKAAHWRTNVQFGNLAFDTHCSSILWSDCRQRSVESSEYKTSCVGGRHNMPPPLHVDLWPSDLVSGVRVACDVGYLCANFSLPRPLCSQLRPNVHDRHQMTDRQTDRRQTCIIA